MDRGLFRKIMVNPHGIPPVKSATTGNARVAELARAIADAIAPASTVQTSGTSSQQNGAASTSSQAASPPPSPDVQLNFNTDAILRSIDQASEPGAARELVRVLAKLALETQPATQAPSSAPQDSQLVRAASRLQIPLETATTAQLAELLTQMGRQGELTALLQQPREIAYLSSLLEQAARREGILPNAEAPATRQPAASDSRLQSPAQGQQTALQQSIPQQLIPQQTTTQPAANSVSVPSFGAAQEAGQPVSTPPSTPSSTPSSQAPAQTSSATTDAGAASAGSRLDQVARELGVSLTRPDATQMARLITHLGEQQQLAEVLSSRPELERLQQALDRTLLVEVARGGATSQSSAATQASRAADVQVSRFDQLAREAGIEPSRANAEELARLLTDLGRRGELGRLLRIPNETQHIQNLLTQARSTPPAPPPAAPSQAPSSQPSQPPSTPPTSAPAPAAPPAPVPQAPLSQPAISATPQASSFPLSSGQITPETTFATPAQPSQASAPAPTAAAATLVNLLRSQPAPEQLAQQVVRQLSAQQPSTPQAPPPSAPLPALPSALLEYVNTSLQTLGTRANAVPANVQARSLDVVLAALPSAERASLMALQQNAAQRPEALVSWVGEAARGGQLVRILSNPESLRALQTILEQLPQSTATQSAAGNTPLPSSPSATPAPSAQVAVLEQTIQTLKLPEGNLKADQWAQLIRTLNERGELTNILRDPAAREALLARLAPATGNEGPARPLPTQSQPQPSAQPPASTPTSAQGNPSNPSRTAGGEQSQIANLARSAGVTSPASGPAREAAFLNALAENGSLERYLVVPAERAALRALLTRATQPATGQQTQPTSQASPPLPVQTSQPAAQAPPQSQGQTPQAQTQQPATPTTQVPPQPTQPTQPQPAQNPSVQPAPAQPAAAAPPSRSAEVPPAAQQPPAPQPLSQPEVPPVTAAPLPNAATLATEASSGSQLLQLAQAAGMDPAVLTPEQLLQWLTQLRNSGQLPQLLQASGELEMLMGWLGQIQARHGAPAALVESLQLIIQSMQAPGQAGPTAVPNSALAQILNAVTANSNLSEAALTQLLQALGQNASPVGTAGQPSNATPLMQALAAMVAGGEGNANAMNSLVASLASANNLSPTQVLARLGLNINPASPMPQVGGVGQAAQPGVPGAVGTPAGEGRAVGAMAWHLGTNTQTESVFTNLVRSLTDVLAQASQTMSAIGRGEFSQLLSLLKPALLAAQQATGQATAGEGTPGAQGTPGANANVAANLGAMHPLQQMAVSILAQGMRFSLQFVSSEHVASLVQTLNDLGLAAQQMTPTREGTVRVAIQLLGGDGSASPLEVVLRPTGGVIARSAAGDAAQPQNQAQTAMPQTATGGQDPATARNGLQEALLFSRPAAAASGGQDPINELLAAMRNFEQQGRMHALEGERMHIFQRADLRQAPAETTNYRWDIPLMTDHPQSQGIMQQMTGLFDWLRPHVVEEAPVPPEAPADVVERWLLEYKPIEVIRPEQAPGALPGTEAQGPIIDVERID